MPERAVVHLENWGVTRHPHYPPTEPCLCGAADGHPRFANGEHITTSPIVALQAGFVATRSGTLYELGRPNLNALSDAFALNREFAYLVLLLSLISAPTPEIPPAASPCASEPAPVISIVALAAMSRNGGSSTIQ
jgi:hypothetical protein